MTLWVFGSSFSSEEDLTVDTMPTWYQLVCDHYGLVLKNISLYSASLDHFLMGWDAHDNIIHDNDRVIVTLPQRELSFLFSNLINITAPWITRNDKYNKGWDTLTRDQQNAFYAYHKHLHDPNTVGFRIKSFLFWVNATASRMKHKIIILFPYEMPFISWQDYPHLLLDSGIPLIRASIDEVGNTDEWDNPGTDTRINHLSDDNHVILSRCIINAWATGKMVSRGFRRKK